MEPNVLRRVLRGLGANAYDQGVTVVVQLLTVPILLHTWGAQLYGEWLILFAIPTYLSMTDLGFSQSAGNDMTARVVRGDKAGALAVFQSVLGFVYACAAVGLIVTTAALWLLPLHDWLHFRTMSADSVRWVLCLLAAEVFVRLPNGVTDAGFRSSGEYAVHIGLSSTARLLQFTVVWLVAVAGGGPVAAAIAFLSVRALATPALAIVLAHRHRWLRFSLTHASRRELRLLFKPATANLALPLAQALNIQGMVLVVGAALGPVPVVVFSTLRTLTRLAMQPVVAVSHAAEPELAAAHGGGDRALLQSLFVHALRASLWIAVGVAGGLVLFGSLILAVWTQGAVQMDPVLFTWLLSSAVATVLWYTALIVLKAANRHLNATLVLVLTSTFALGVAGLFLGWTGDVAAAGMSLLLMDAVLALHTLRAAAQLLGVAPTRGLMQAVNPCPLVNALLRRGYVGFTAVGEPTVHK